LRIALLRVGIDTGCGGIHGPLYSDGSFEYIPIPDVTGLSRLTYGDMIGRHGIPLADYFPLSMRDRARRTAVHCDPEFETFTYGDPTRNKAGLRRLKAGDLLVFYCGLEGYGFQSPPALYLIGILDVRAAGRATDFADEDLWELFSENFHVRHKRVLDQQRNDLVLVKGGSASRLLKKAYAISGNAIDSAGRPMKVLSHDMRKVFGNFGGRTSIQRSSPRWIDPRYVNRAYRFLERLD